MPKIIEGAQSKLPSNGLSDSDEAIKVINVIVNSMVKSVNGRNQYLPSNSVDSGLTAYETIFKKIATASVSNLDEAGLFALSALGALWYLIVKKRRRYVCVSRFAKLPHYYHTSEM